MQEVSNLITDLIPEAVGLEAELDSENRTVKFDAVIILWDRLMNERKLNVRGSAEILHYHFGQSETWLRRYRGFQERRTPELIKKFDKGIKLAELLRESMKGERIVCDTCKKEKDGSKFNWKSPKCIKCCQKARKEKEKKPPGRPRKYSPSEAARQRMDAPKDVDTFNAVEHLIMDMKYTINQHFVKEFVDVFDLLSSDDKLLATSLLLEIPSEMIDFIQKLYLDKGENDGEEKE